MPGGRIFTLAAAASLLELLPLVVAHGHDENGTDLGEMNAASVSATAAAHNAAEAVEALPSYFWHPEHAGLMYAHIALMILGWVVVLPVGTSSSDRLKQHLANFLIQAARLASLVRGSHCLCNPYSSSSTRSAYSQVSSTSTKPQICIRTASTTRLDGL